MIALATWYSLDFGIFLLSAFDSYGDVVRNKYKYS